MRKFFRPRPGRFSTMVAFVQGKQLDAGITVNGVTTISLGGAHRKSYISRASAAVVTVPVDADGAVTAVLKKYDASANEAVTLTDALNLETLVAKESGLFVFITTLTDAQRLLDEGDTLFVEVTTATASVDTQPVGLVITAELLVQE